MPSLQHLLSLPFGFAVMVERISRIVLCGIGLVKTIHSHGREKYNAFAAVLLHGFQRDLHASYVGVVVQGDRRDVIAVLSGEKYHDIGALEPAVHLLLRAHVAYCGDLIEEVARKEVDVPAVILLRIFTQKPQKPRANKSAGPYHCDFHKVLICLFLRMRSLFGVER